VSLRVLLYGSPIGALRPGEATDYTFEYAESVVAEAGPGAIVLSNALPVRSDEYSSIETRTFFEGLLPESARRDAIARELKISPNDSYGLLRELGRDCAGAIVIVPSEDDGSPRAEDEVEWLSDEQLEELIDELPRRPFGVVGRTGRLRLSLAGVQRKLGLIRREDHRFALPTAAAPSTHLIKPEYESEYPGLASNEMFCMQIAQRLGLPAAETELATIAGRPCVVSRRYDREQGEDGTIRLHQEDFCQALGIPSNLKYQADLGPSFRLMRRLLEQVGRGADVRTMIRAAVLNFAIGNSDAHGKNFSILFAPEGRRLAPLYDLVSTTVYEGLEEEMAMSIGENFMPETVGIADWLDMSADCDVAVEPFFVLVRETALDVRERAIALSGEAHRAGWHDPVIDRIVAVVERRSESITSQIEAR
jgi:serine/threonine-protein kinase HipA